MWWEQGLGWKVFLAWCLYSPRKWQKWWMTVSYYFCHQVNHNIDWHKRNSSLSVHRSRLPPQSDSILCSCFFKRFSDFLSQPFFSFPLILNVCGYFCARRHTSSAGIGSGHHIRLKPNDSENWKLLLHFGFLITQQLYSRPIWLLWGMLLKILRFIVQMAETLLMLCVPRP